MASCPPFLLAPQPPPPLVAVRLRRSPLAGRAHLLTSRSTPRPRRRQSFRSSSSPSSSSSSSSGPRKRSPRPQQRTEQRPGRGSGSAVDPVGFLAKTGVSDRAFAQFLRDRYVRPPSGVGIQIVFLQTPSLPNLLESTRWCGFSTHLQLFLSS
jgi:1,4-alpha-glucan branching enzyme